MDALAARHIHEGEGTPEADWLAWPGLARVPSRTVDELVPSGRRAVIVAPHPDDELLAAGGLLALLADAGRETLVVAATDGDASHGESPNWPRARLLRERPLESERALRALGLSGHTLRLGLPDGGVAENEDALAQKLEALLRPADVLLTTWRLDGHPDHEATGRAAAVAAARSGATLLEAPVWAWHWAAPGDARMPWERALRLPLDPPWVRRKTGALWSYASQLQPDASTGRSPILRASTVARAARPFELFFFSP